MLQAVSSILTAYHGTYGIDRDNEFPIRTKLLQPYIEERGVVDKIAIYEAAVTSENIVALVQKYKGEADPYSGLLDYANIYYAESFNLCWRRFGVCKEMYHCMIDRSDEDRVADLASLKTLLELLAANTTALTGEFAPLEREQEAELLALETLFPVEFRQKYINDEIEDPAEHEALAEQFKIPLDYVILACQPNYVRNVTKLRGRLLTLG